MGQMRVFVLCPDYNVPSGGVRRLYRHVDVLRRHGVESAILHESEGFRCTWFANDTPVMGVGQVSLTPSDYLVVPELYGQGLAKLAPGVPKVVFNQNSYFTFRGFPITGADGASPYLNPDVVAVFAVSEDNAAYLRYAFPTAHIIRVHYGIDPLFGPRWPKRKAMAFMPRKNAEDVVQVVNMLRGRGSLEDWELVPIDGLPEAQVAERLAHCAIFLSFGTVEGCPLPPLEAMASGCVVIGYHGRGGKEYFNRSFSYSVEAGDTIGFAKTVESVLEREKQSPGTLDKQGRQAAAYVGVNYSPQREEQDIVTAWRSIAKERFGGVFT
jgi:glycosyltransferase involved in cell wall biosynthesis